jgi:hypothetical protein
MHSKWRNWQSGPEARKNRPDEAPTKPTELDAEPSFDGFEGLEVGLFRNIQTRPAEAPTKPTELDAFALLNSVEARFWVDNHSACCIGIWECVDSAEVREAAARVCPGAKVMHLEQPGVPLRFKSMSRRIARIEDAKEPKRPGLSAPRALWPRPAR